MELTINFCDEKLPPVGEWVLLIVVNSDTYNKSSPEHFTVESDEGYLSEDGTWVTGNDWDEGQLWAVVGWARLPSEQDIRKHGIKWQNNNSKLNGEISDMIRSWTDSSNPIIQ